MARNIEISVVICTYNRARLLAQVLETLCLQAVDPSTYEILVVDNNSTDETSTVAADFVRRYTNVRYCLETQTGASYARNRGWQEALGEYVAYTDDDCKIPPHWIATAQEIIATLQPTVFGGPYYAFYDGQKPAWFKDAYGSSVETPIARNLEITEHLPEGNMFCARKIFAKFGGFRTDLGPSGNTIGFGEGTEWLIRGRKQNPDTVVYYDPRLYVYHLVRPEKFTWSRIIRRSFADGRISYRVFNANRPVRRGAGAVALRTLRHAFLLLIDPLFGLLVRDRKQYPYIQNYWYEHSLRHLSSLGNIYEEIQARQRTNK